MRELIIIACQDCRRRNYSFFQNKAEGKLELKKYCPSCRRHTVHKQTK